MCMPTPSLIEWCKTCILLFFISCLLVIIWILSILSKSYNYILETILLSCYHRFFWYSYWVSAHQQLHAVLQIWCTFTQYKLQCKLISAPNVLELSWCIPGVYVQETPVLETVWSICPSQICESHLDLWKLRWNIKKYLVCIVHQKNLQYREIAQQNW